jgi:uncharacterized protein (TIGR00251 family)
VGEDLLLVLRLTPRSSKDALEGLERLSDGRCVLKARVRAVPEDGKANEAILKLIAKALDLPRQSVSLESGATSRIKQVRLQGGEGVTAQLRLLL